MKPLCKSLIGALLLAAPSLSVADTIPVEWRAGDMTASLQAAIDRAKSGTPANPTVIMLQNRDYAISRQHAATHIYHISNTTSETENPDPTKHIGLWLKEKSNMVIDGAGAHLKVSGPITSFVTDNCENITIKNLTIDYIDPTVPELTVASRTDNELTLVLHKATNCRIENNTPVFFGSGWKFSGGIAQLYRPSLDITWRTSSPMEGIKNATMIGADTLMITYAAKSPDCEKGDVYQLRDTYRTEVCGLVSESKNVRLENLRYGFTGNFGIVAQMSDGLTLDRVFFEPLPESGRTCAGFADMLQVSGCRGLINVQNSRFIGAHDDPINIHGTHLKIISQPKSNVLKLKYMHHQTFGFRQYFAGDTIEIVDAHTLLPLQSATVKSAVSDNDREITITLNEKVKTLDLDKQNLVVENISATPSVMIRRNYFARIPTRGILVSTRRPVTIAENVFFRMQMSGILIADDARSWFESGPVHNVTIRDNEFIECGEPVILIAPENDKNGGFVHRDIKIYGNRFLLKGNTAISARSVDGLDIHDNFITGPDSPESDAIKVTDSRLISR